MKRHVLPEWRWLALMAVISLLPSLALANNVLSIKHENDGLVSGDDGHFTSGLELAWSFEPGKQSWAQRLAVALPDNVIRRADRAAFRLVHQIYTPNNIEQRSLIVDDRPYAGFIYGSLSLYEDVPLGNWRQATDLHLDIGLVGPSSLAESTQSIVHRLTSNDRPEGWHNQLGDEPIANITLQRQWWHTPTSSIGRSWAHGPRVSATLGNLYTYASTGYSVRWGNDAPGIPTLPPNPDSRYHLMPAKSLLWYLFASVDGYHMAQNLTLDGNTFKDSHSVERKEWVGDVSAGLALAWKDWQVTYAAVQRSREFHGQEEQDRFAAVTLSRRF